MISVTLAVQPPHLRVYVTVIRIDRKLRTHTRTQLTCSMTASKLRLTRQQPKLLSLIPHWIQSFALLLQLILLWRAFNKQFILTTC